MKIFRLSLFNLKKNRKEAAAIAFLTMITTLMLSVFMANQAKINRGYDDSFEASGSRHYCSVFEDEKYRDEYRDILEGMTGVHDVTEEECIAAISTDVEKDGSLLSYSFIFVTEKTERRLEDFFKRDQLPDEEIARLAHPIWLPMYFKLSEGYQTGDTLTLLRDGLKYDFEIAGFYEHGIISQNVYQCVVSENDYAMFSLILNGKSEGKHTGLWFDCDNDFSFEEFARKCEESSYENIDSCRFDFSFMKEKGGTLQFINIFLYFLAFLSSFTMLSALFVITHRISEDIEAQMQQIGALEAMGYRAHEISLSYAGEYLISGGAGSVLGGMIALLVSPAIDAVVQKMMGRTLSSSVQPVRIMLAVVLVAVLVIAIALVKAAEVRKYPPVTALRKGIGTHHFGRNFFPLERSNGNINLAIAAKSFIGDLRSSAGVAICVIAAGIAIIFCANFLYFFRDGIDGLVTLCGIDMPVDVELINGADPYEVRDEIAAMPEVRKALLSYTNPLTSALPIKGSDNKAYLTVFDDYSQAENIFLIRGRFPEHDNEIMITVARSEAEGIDIGDSVVLKGNGIENKYIITGVTSGMMNNGMMIYLTTEGYMRTEFNARPIGISVYLADGIDNDTFEERLYSVFGKSVKDSLNAADNGGSLEDRVKAAADEKLAALVTYYGVTNADYAVVIGDQLIKGSSRSFVIKEVTSFLNVFKQQAGPIATMTKTCSAVVMALITVVVAVILWLIVSSAVKRQRKSLGIMKSMGYSSKDLMTQISLKTMPAAVVSLIISAILTKYIYSAFWIATFKAVKDINLPVTAVTCVALAAFCYAVSYICAGRVKAISVTELMTE